MRIKRLHPKMPDDIDVEKASKRTLEQDQRSVRIAEQKIQKTVQELKDGRPSQDGIGSSAHLAGLFGQRICFRNKTNYIF